MESPLSYSFHPENWDVSGKFNYKPITTKPHQLKSISNFLSIKTVDFLLLSLKKYPEQGNFHLSPCCLKGKVEIIFDTRDKANRKPKPIRSTPEPS